MVGVLQALKSREDRVANPDDGRRPCHPHARETSKRGPILRDYDRNSLAGSFSGDDRNRPSLAESRQREGRRLYRRSRSRAAH